MTKTPPLYDRVFALIEAQQPMTQSQICAALDIRVKQADYAVRTLRQQGRIFYELDCWRVKSARAGLPDIPPALREAVYALCNGEGIKLKEVQARTGLDRFTARRVLHVLRERRMIRYTVAGWVVWNPGDDERPTGPQITDEDRQWQRYWHPENRLNRLRERACC